jgi:hypothetical protein
MPNNQHAKEQRQAVEDAATTILAYLDMGAEGEVEQLLYTTDRHTLGLIICTWFQLCIAHRGVTTTIRAASKTMDYLNATAALEDRPTEEAEADKHAASLLFHLTDNAMKRYATAWNKTINHQPDISSAVAARMLGFVKGMLSDIPEPKEK